MARPVIALTSPQFDLRLLGDLEDEGVQVIPVTGEEFSFITNQLDGDGIYEVGPDA